eukprot:1003676-Lingulodinium_polyedra.AAC.1
MCREQFLHWFPSPQQCGAFEWTRVQMRAEAEAAKRDDDVYAGTRAAPRFERRAVGVGRADGRRE